MEKHTPINEAFEPVAEAGTAEAGTESPYASRLRKIDTAVRGLHQVALEALAPGATEAAQQLSAGVAIAHIINLVGYSVAALNEIAEAQQRISEVVLLDYMNNQPPEPINPTDKIVRNPLKRNKSPLTTPD